MQILGGLKLRLPFCKADGRETTGNLSFEKASIPDADLPDALFAPGSREHAPGPQSLLLIAPPFSS